MTRDEAIHILQAFGEGIRPTRDMFNTSPTHADWHQAVAVITGIPWDYLGPQSHRAHHRDVASALGINAASDESHAEHSTQIMVAIAKRTRGTSTT